MVESIGAVYRRYQRSLALRAGSWYVIATFAQKALNVIAIPIFTHLLTTEEFGTVSVYISWVSIGTIVLTLNVSATTTNAKIDYTPEAFKRFLSSILTLATLVSLLGAAVLAFLPSTLVNQLFGLQKPLMVLAVIGALVSFYVRVPLDVWRINFNYRNYILTNFLVGSYTILLSVALIFLPQLFIHDYDRALGRIVGFTAVNLAFGLVFFVRIVASGRTFYHREFWGYALHLSLPLILHSLAAVVMVQFDRLLINQYVGSSEAGIYTLAYQIADFPTMLWAALNSAWVPWFYQQMAAANFTAIRARSKQYTLVFAGVTVLLILASPFIIRVLTPQSYWQAGAIIPVVTASGFFTLLYSFYANVEFYVKRTSWIALMTVISAAVNVLLNVWLMPIYGYYVAAWTTLASYVALFLLHALVVIFYLKQRDTFDFFFLAGTGAAVVALATLVHLMLS